MGRLEKIIGACILALAGCSSDVPPPEPKPPVFSRDETWKNRVMDEGVCLTSWWYNDYLSSKCSSTLESLHSLGVESISLLVTQYQDTTNSIVISPGFNKTPTNAALANVVSKAKSLGMKTLLKPHVDVLDGSWRGDISFSNETDWSAWFASYTNFIKSYAEFAELKGVDVLVIGTELKGTSHRSEWASVISDIRGVYSGQIVYAANWDEYKNITWWDLVDFIGVNAYFPLTSSMNPSVSELEAAWAPRVQEMRDFSLLHNKKVVITEVGYESLDGTNISPNGAPSSIRDEQEQADCYRAMFNCLLNQDFVAGIYPWMKYFDWIDNVKPNGFDFAGKLAEGVVNDTYHLSG